MVNIPKMTAVLLRMRPRLNLYSLRVRLLLLFGGLLILLMVAIGVGVLSFLAAGERSAWQGRQSEAAEGAAQRVASFMVQTINSLRTVGLLKQTYIRADAQVLARLLSQNPAILEITRLDGQGQLIASRARDKPVLSEFFTTLQASWFRHARAGEIYVGEVQLSATAEPYLILALPTLDQGVVAARLKMDLLWEVVRQIRFGESGNAYVIDDQGEIIAHPTPQVVIQRARINLDAKPAAMQKESGAAQYESYINFLGESVVGVARAIPGTNWTIITELRQTEATAQLRLAILLFCGVAVAVILFSLRTTLYLLNRTVLRPLAALQTGAERVGQGDLTQQIPILRADEFGVVTHTFNEMVSKLATREQQLAEQTNALAAEIEEHRHTERALQQSEQRNRLILDAIPDALFRVSVDGVLLDYRSSQNVQFFATPAKFLGRRLSEVLPEEMGTAAFTVIAQTLQTGAMQTFEFQLLSANDLRDYEARLIMINEYELLSMVRDITERKRQEKILQANLEREHQLHELKSRFMTLMSHEFRTPLAIILTSSDIVRRAGSKLTDDMRERHLVAIRRQVHHLTRVLDDILTISQTETTGLELNLAPVNLEKFCQTIAQEFQPLAPEHLLLFSATGADQIVHLDGKLMRQAITNLLSNAVKYSPAGGTIYIDLQCSNGTATFQVRDSGIGIPEADQKLLFTPFHRAQNIDHAPGIGLGLTIVKQAIQQHGGTVTCESTVGVGSTFSLQWPLSAA